MLFCIFKDIHRIWHIQNDTHAHTLMCVQCRQSLPEEIERKTVWWLVPTQWYEAPISLSALGHQKGRPSCFSAQWKPRRCISGVWDVNMLKVLVFLLLVSWPLKALPPYMSLTHSYTEDRSFVRSRESNLRSSDWRTTWHQTWALWGPVECNKGSQSRRSVGDEGCKKQSLWTSRCF